MTKKNNSSTKYIEILGIFVIIWLYLVLDYIGLCKKNRNIVISSCVIRIILIIVTGISFILVLIFNICLLSNQIIITLISLIIITLYGMFKSYLQFEILNAIHHPNLELTVPHITITRPSMISDKFSNNIIDISSPDKLFPHRYITHKDAFEK